MTSTLTPDGAIPLPAGPHSWLWKLEEVRDWSKVIARHKALGFVGAHAHANGPMLASKLTPALRRQWEDAGLHFGASLALDTGVTTRDSAKKPVAFAPTPRVKLRDHVLRTAELLGPGCTVGLNWEMRWERTSWHPARREDAAWIADELTRRLAGFGVVLWDAPWWKPGVHSSAPTDEFGRAMTFRVPQTYFIFTETDPATGKPVDKLMPIPAAWKRAHPELPQTPAAYMVDTARVQYAARKVVRPMAWGFQAAAGAGADRKVGQCLRDYPVTFWWHALRLEEPRNHPTRDVLATAALIRRYTPGRTLEEGVREFQTDNGLTVDGWIGPQVVAEARTHFGGALAGL